MMKWCKIEDDPALPGSTMFPLASRSTISASLSTRSRVQRRRSTRQTPQTLTCFTRSLVSRPFWGRSPRSSRRGRHATFRLCGSFTRCASQTVRLYETLQNCGEGCHRNRRCASESYRQLRASLLKNWQIFDETYLL
jgi:hypothetical protein